jgi:prepilin-type N-terminal cleavage/methylation domain-containing protein
MACPCLFKNIGAFTLSELLIALAVLGLIAAFTLPKVLADIGQKQAEARLKDTITTISSAAYAISLDPWDANTKAIDKFAAKLQFTKLCRNNTVTEGCSLYSPDNNAGNPWAAIVLPNGGIAYFRSTETNPSAWFYIDASGGKIDLGSSHLSTVGCTWDKPAFGMKFNIGQKLNTQYSWVHGNVGPRPILKAGTVDVHVFSADSCYSFYNNLWH